MKELFDEVLTSFEGEDTKEMAAKCIDNAPDYFWKVSASSSFKYHPDFARETPLGLAKHTVAVCRYLNYLLEPECVREQFTSHLRDLLRIAAIVHDMWKSGNQEDYERSKWTKFDHPLIAAQHVREMDWIPNLTDGVAAINSYITEQINCSSEKISECCNEIQKQKSTIIQYNKYLKNLLEENAKMHDTLPF